MILSAGPASNTITVASRSLPAHLAIFMHLLSLVMLNLHNFLAGFRYCCQPSAVVATVPALWLWLWLRLVLWVAEKVVALFSVTNLSDLGFNVKFSDPAMQF